ncbi:hypothetical protein BOTNAR_0192g00010 [Botryotinia narcissicola]|uniref:ASTRA-associated protein 1 n=1 Tax=Botryotinia narcissicola TaxID=278944 RepID=A0A4Z1I8K7_9HELO|nr:hypothetical protein BOTNAR_0192g00010 [Botryotinia narcissicola]
MSKVLPVDTVSEERRKPWILHMLDVNTMNFCAFAVCSLYADINVKENREKDKDETAEAEIQKDEKGEDQLLIAVPNTLTSESIDIFHIPTLHRLHNIPSPGPEKPGMIMCLSLFFHPSTKCLTVLSGYEDGSVSVFSLNSPISPLSTSPSTAPSSRSPQWNTIYHSKSHIQPILSLSLDPSPDRKFFLTSGADDRIIKYLIPTTTTPFSPSPSPPTSHLKAILSSTKDEPKILKTAHAGQQSIEMRNDGKIAVTAGWDGRARVYGVAKMRELAVLKWHKDGCFAVAVADVLEGAEVESGGGEKGKELVGRLRQLDVKGERLRKARETHWVAVGGKDGKVSLQPAPPSRQPTLLRRHHSPISINISQLNRSSISQSIHRALRNIKTRSRGINDQDIDRDALIRQGVTSTAIRRIPSSDCGCTADAGEGGETALDFVLGETGFETVGSVGAGDDGEGASGVVVAGVVGYLDSEGRGEEEGEECKGVTELHFE